MPRPPHRILICDDDEDVRLHLEAVLLALGFAVTRTISGHDAIAALSHDRHDLVLLDILMPGISGLETLRRIKNQPSLARIPVVMLTAIDEHQARQGSLELGAAAFLTKPIDQPQLVRTILKILLDWEDAPA